MSYTGYSVYAAPGYEAVSTAYLQGLRKSADKQANTQSALDKRIGELARATEEIGELKDLLKQVLRQAQVRESASGIPKRGEEYVRHYILGDRGDLRLEVEKVPGIFGEKDRRRVKVWVPKPADPDEAVLAKLRVPYSTSAPYILKEVRKAGLDITLKDQGKAAVNADATSLKLVS